MPDRIAGLRGRHPVKAPADRFPLGYVDEYQSLPTPIFPIDLSGGRQNWFMLGNGPDPTLTVNNGQPVGDCTFAGRQHDRMVKAIHYGTFATETWEDSNQLVTEYLAYDHGHDEGANISDLLLAWYKAGKILAFAPVDHTSPAACDAAMAAFHGLYVGVSLTDDADQLFGEGKPWTTANGEQPDPNDGHCIVKVGSSSTADTWITWGALQRSTKAWTVACLDEAWVIVTSEDQLQPAALAALRADIDALHGTGGGPAPAPKPKPKPAPHRRKSWLRRLLGRRDAVTPAPTPPVNWDNPSADVAYAAALALFALSVLTALGVTVPSNLSGLVQELAAAAQSIVAGIVALIGLVSKHSVQKAAFRAYGGRA